METGEPHSFGKKYSSMPLSERALNLVSKKIPFVAARHFTELRPGRHVQLIVIHSMEAPEKGTTAESVARYFARGTVRASAHYCIDNDSIVQCCQTKDVAWAAPGANRNGIQLELAGYARQTREQWLDPFSLAMLENAAALCSRILMPKFSVPARFLKAADLKELAEDTSQKGFTTHSEVSKAFHLSSHWDPGPNFPIDVFLSMLISQ